LGDKKEVPIVSGKIGQKQFKTDSGSAFVDVKKHDAAFEGSKSSKGQKQDKG